MKIGYYFKITSLLAVLFVTSISAQKLSFRIGGYLSKYDLSDLKYLQGQVSYQIQDKYKVNFSNLSSFPDYYSYVYQLALRDISTFNLGIEYTFSSTGARSSYSDYSGEITNDYKIKAKSYGIIIEELLYSKFIDVIFGMKIQYINTDFQLNQMLKIGSYKDEGDIKAVANNYGFTPSVALQYNLLNFIAKIEAGYLVTTEGNLHTPDNDEAYLIFWNKKINAKWDGFRIGLILGYNFELPQ